MTSGTPHTPSRRHVLGALGAAALVPVATSLGATPASARGRRPAATDVLISSSSFGSYAAFEAAWAYLYPWGSDHNGSARMVGSSTDHSHISLSGGVLTLTSTPVSDDEGNSSKPPNLPIRYHSGTVYAQQQVLVDDAYPQWELRGEFQAPSATGTWPAFWITGVNSWPPESDILEYKGTAQCWSNTYKNPSGGWSNTIVDVANPADWHEYRAVLTQTSSTDVEIQYYLDGTLQGTHQGANFVGQPMWIIIDLQMEGSSGTPGPTGTTYFKARNPYVARTPA
jgi:hypothetical protein